MKSPPAPLPSVSSLSEFAVSCRSLIFRSLQALDEIGSVANREGSQPMRKLFLLLSRCFWV
jgi:hypothetical protein